MKLYTLEEIKEILKSIDLEEAIDTFIEFADPIELPSDEEIDNQAFFVPFDGKEEFYDKGFIKGAKWMKEQILNQNK
jgi:hypothetical protein